MKAMKKLLALVLAVCMLIGMPLSIDVAAVGTSDATEFKVYGAYEMTDTQLATIRSLDTTISSNLNDDNGIMMSWSMNPNNNGTQYAVVAVDAQGNILNENIFEWQTNAYWDASMFYWTFNTVTWTTVKAAIAEGGAYAGASLKFVFIEDTKHAEMLTGSAANDGVVDDWYARAKVSAATTDKTWFMKSTQTLTINEVVTDVAMYSLYTTDEMFDVARTYVVDDQYLHLEFTEAVNNNGKYNVSIQIVNNNNDRVYKAADGTYNTTGDGTALSTMNFNIRTQAGAFFPGLVNSSSEIKSYAQMEAMLAEANAASDSDETYYLRLCLRESHINFDAQGSTCNNGFVDHLWGASSLKALRANQNHGTNGDALYVDLTGPDDNTTFYMTDAQLVRDPNGVTDRVIVTFSEGLDARALNTQYGCLRIYNKNGNLMQISGTTASTTTGSHAQWGVTELKYTNDLTKIIFNVPTNGSFNDVATYDDIIDSLKNVTDGDGKALVDPQTKQFINGYRFVFSLSDNTQAAANGYTQINNNGLVDKIYSATGKKLWANNRQNTGEDRAMAVITDNNVTGLKITDFNVINNHYALLYLNQDINLRKGIFAGVALVNANGTLMWHDATAGYNTSTGTDLQSSFGSINYFGNAKNVLLLKFGQADDTKARSFQWIQDHLAAAGEGYKLVLRMNDEPRDNEASDTNYQTLTGYPECEQVLDSLVGVSSEYAKIYTGGTTFNYTHYDLRTDGLDTVGMTIVDGNTARFEFTKPVIMEKPVNDNYTIWLTKYKYNNGDRKFNGVNGITPDDGTGLWQSKFDGSTLKAVNEFGEPVTGASKYWTIDLPANGDKTLTEAAYQTKTQSTWTYGVRFENNVRGMAGVTDQIYTEDKSLYLPSNSSEGDYRHFVELCPDSATIDPVEIVSAKVIDTHTVQVTFSQPVKHNIGSGNSNGTAGTVNVRVSDEYNRVHTGYIESAAEWQPIDEDGDGFATVVNVKLTTTSNSTWGAANNGISGFAKNYRNNADWWGSGKHDLCVGFDDPNGATVGDGYITAVRDIYGNWLQASPYFASTGDKTYMVGDSFKSRNIESALYSIADDDFLILNDEEISINTVTSHLGADAIVVTTPAMMDVAQGGYSVRVYNGTTLVKIDGQDAIWNVATFSNIDAKNYQFATTIVGKFGCDSVAEIKALLAEKNIEYTDVYLAIQENKADAAKPYFGDGYLYHWDTYPHRYPLEADIVDAVNGDMALVTIGGAFDSEVLAISNMTIHKNTAGDYLLEVTMNHAMDMDLFMNSLKAGDLNLWLNANHTEAYEFVNTETGEVDAAASKIAHSKIEANAIEVVSNTKFVAVVSDAQYNTVMNHVNNINANYPGKAQLGIRLEHANATAKTGSHIESGYMISTESGVLPAIMHTAWGNQRGRVWAAASAGEDVTVQALVDGAYVADVSPVLESVESDKKVVLITNVTFNGQNGVVVEDGAVLDLNGKTLNLGTGSLVGNGHVIDSTNGNGLVKIEYLAENQMAKFATANPQLPLYDSAKTGYRLFNTEVIAVGTKEATTDSCKYGFKVTFTNSAAYALLKDVDHNDTTVAFELDTARLDEAHRSCPLIDAKLADYAQKMIDTPDTNWVITLKITGLEKLNGDALTVAGKITSAGTEMRVTIPVTNA